MKLNAVNFPEVNNDRTTHIIDASLALIREAIADKIGDVENSAAEAAGDADGDGDDEKPITAKLTISIKWPAGEPVPEITVKASYSITRFTECTGLADGDQAKLPL